MYCVAGTVSSKEFSGYCGFDYCIETYYEYEAKGLEDLCEHRHDYYDIKYIYPSINFCTIPPQTSDSVKNHLIKSFALFWSDEAASANKIRTALELFLDHFEVKRTEFNAKGKERRLSLEERLKLFKANTSFGHFYEKLLAIKFLGNAGSHVQSITKEDLLDAYEILEFVFEECCQKPERVDSVVKKAKSLNTKYKP